MHRPQCGALCGGAAFWLSARRFPRRSLPNRNGRAVRDSRDREHRASTRTEQHLRRAATPGISLLQSLRIEFEASVVRLALTAAYERLGHRAGMIRCLLAQNQPLAWRIHFPPRV